MYLTDILTRTEVKAKLCQVNWTELLRLSFSFVQNDIFPTGERLGNMSA